jgi:hypothetical protein
MRAYSVTTKCRPGRKARHLGLALALCVCALAIPVSASASPVDAPAASQQSSPSSADYSSLDDEPTFVTDSPAATGDGFDWSSAAVGAGAVLAVLALGGAALLTVRGHTATSPATSASSRRGDRGEAGDGR